jgi:outer membrane protein OmpU
MKAALLAASALALLAGAAGAEITLSGSARMGLTYVDDGTDSATAFSSRVRIGFTASGETDSGLTFGASMRVDQNGGNTDGTRNDDSAVYISGGFGKLSMGDLNGAADALVGQVSGVGYGPHDALQELAFVGSHKTAVYYEYSDGALTFGVGSGQLIDGDRTYSVGAKYAANGYSVALGWESDSFTDVKQISISGSAVFGPATVKARISDSNVTDADRTYAISVDYLTGATTLTAFYSNFGNTLVDTDFPDFFLSEDTQHIGIGAAYDLGGGAKVAGGVVRQSNDDAEDDQTFADVGLKFSF